MANVLDIRFFGGIYKSENSLKFVNQFTMSAGDLIRSRFFRILVAPWFTFGSLLVPVDSLSAIFWLPFGAIWRTFARPRVPFSRFSVRDTWGLRASFFVLLLYVLWKSCRHQRFSCNFS